MQVATATKGSVTVLGSINLDLVFGVARHPMPGETLAATGQARHGGGKGANQAVAAARAGSRVAMIGAVGMDDAGAMLLALLEREAIDCAAVRRIADAATGTAIVMVDAVGENAIVVDGGANLRLRPEDVPDAPPGDVLLAQLESPVAAIAALFERAPRSSIRVLNAAPFRAEAQPLLAQAELAIVNEAELAGYCGIAQAPATAEEVAACARRLLGREGQWIVATRGGEGVVAVRDGETIMAPAWPAQVVDTTGAGDCFCGVLAASLAQGLAMDAAIRRASRAAAITVGRHGAIAAMPLRRELDTACV